jgi:alpha-L-fucosidase 2
MDDVRADHGKKPGPFAAVWRGTATGLVFVSLALGGPSAWADATTSAHAVRIVAQHNGVWNSPPAITDTGQALDAPLLGNGDVGVAILGRPNAMTFLLSKNEFWSLNNGTVKAMARMNLAIGGLSGATYRTQQDIARGEVLGTFALAGNTLQTTSCS